MIDFQKYSNLYSQLEIKDTAYLAYRDLPGLLNKYTNGKKALDYGCGAGRSTRFLKELGYDVEGVDSSIEMIQQARKLDHAISYTHLKNGKLLFLHNAYDLILASFVFFETSSLLKMQVYFQEIYNVLKPKGIFVIIAGSMEMYKNNWLSLYTDYPENINPKSGDKVRIKLINADLELEDYFWTDNDYKTASKESGFSLLQSYNPLGTKIDGYNWISETLVSPYTIYILQK